MKHYRNATLGSVLVAMALGGCGKDVVEPTPPLGESDFISADGVAGESAQRNGDDASADAGAASPSESAGDGDERSVERGDIYRMLSSGHLLNLNPYRGLQVVDLSNVEAPTLLGKLQVSGTPVELYVVGDRAVVLLNSWQGYYGTRDDIHVESVNGGLILTVDLSDPSNPREIARAVVPGYISTSRLAREGDSTALYVAASIWGTYEDDYEAHTIVKSFDLSGATIRAKTELDLGGYVTDIEATPEALLVATYDYRWDGGSGEQLSRVSVIDISSASGRMTRGDEVRVAGYVAKRTNMDLHDGILRVASGAQWGASPANHIQTFDAHDLSHITPVDDCAFGEGEQLFATLFSGNRGFMVTYLQVDPFHAFSIDSAGHCEEKSEFIVSGWNDYFVEVSGGDRLIGIGNDEGNVAVSLYDVSDLENDSPLLARAEVAADNSWSEAAWDDRAFSVIEDAVKIRAADGTWETGVVLMPFSGYNDSWSEYTAAVQIYTFSDHTLTRRGLMDHGTPVRRSFLAGEETTANLSDSSLSLFDTENPEDAREVGRIELAPRYDRVMRFGDHLVRVKGSPSYWSSANPVSHVEVIAEGDDPDRGHPIASLEIPGYAQLFQVGDLLVSVETVYGEGRYLEDGSYEVDQTSTVNAYDFSDPTEPRLAGTLETDRIASSGYGGYYGGYYGRGGAVADCFDCGGGGRYYGYYGYGYGGGPTVVGSAIAFPRFTGQQELLGTQRGRTLYPDSYGCETDDEGRCEEYASGGIYCSQLRPVGEDEFGPEVCSGRLEVCSTGEDGTEWNCRAAEEGEVHTTEYTYEQEQYRYWSSLSIDVLDLRDAAHPSLADAIDLPDEDEYAGLVADGSGVTYSYRRPADVEGDDRPFVRYYAQRIDLANPGEPSLESPINVPGSVLRIEGDTLYTQDLSWGEIAEDGTSTAHTVVHRVERRDGRAYLQASHSFLDRRVENVRLDGEGHMLVSHQPMYGYYWASSDDDQGTHLAILDADDLDVVSDVVVDSWATFTDAQNGRALFQVSGGLLLMNVRDASRPYMQAYFGSMGWPSEILFEGNDITFAAYEYGIYSFDARTRNLLKAD